MKKEILIGFIVGMISTTLGVLICTFIVSQIKNVGFSETFNLYLESDTLWMLLVLGALPNLAVFFGFLKINREYRARGVVLATFVTAITAYIIYFF